MEKLIEIYEELKGANLTEGQSRAMLRGVTALVEDGVAGLVTKHDFELGLRQLKTKLDSKLLTMEVKFESGRVDTLKWMVKLLIGGMTIVLGGTYFMFALFMKH